MRTLFGALVGALLGGAIVAGLTSFCGVQDYWPIVLAGLAAGIVMRWLASSEHISYLRGALAALATVLAMIGGPLVGAKLISQQKPSIAKVEAPVNDAEDAAKKDAGDGGPIVDMEPPPMPLLSKAKGTIGRQRGDVAPLDAVLMAVGCLLAYQVGKGAKCAKCVAEPDAQEPTAEDASDGGEESSDVVTG